MLFIQDLSYTHPNRELLFQHLHLAVNAHDKIALVGNNGAGKSTLLRLVAGQPTPNTGQIERAGSCGMCRR